ncbi:hypothetical protein EJB05_11097 [Eragrostis curvula]|uniref:DUF6598 domain-containing protein n=1 Tax=Eragrostis curvula TaxID=38414 RepID=A0A5J9VNM4_9POAL|nr:hypothetical protein EJB05_11097 [Eragrostis curvula]
MGEAARLGRNAERRKTEMNLDASNLALEWQKKMEQYEKEYLERGGPEPAVEETESELDIDARRRYTKFRYDWITLWSSNYGSFEDSTGIPYMRYTHEPAPPCTWFCNTLQIFSARVAGLKCGLQWPLDVYGMVAVRDIVDRSRNIIFSRGRDNCQTLTETVPVITELKQARVAVYCDAPDGRPTPARNPTGAGAGDPFLVLTGPTHAVVLMDHVTFEVDLKVKGVTKFEDKVLSLLAKPLILHESTTLGSRLFYQSYRGTRSTLEFKLADIGRSVEATIFVRITDGSWPDGYHGQFAACTAGIDHEKVILLDFEDENTSVIVDGSIELSRRVISVGVGKKLKVSVKAWLGDYAVVEEDRVDFTPMDAGLSSGSHRLRVGSCEMEVTVAWSLIASSPEPRRKQG